MNGWKRSLRPMLASMERLAIILAELYVALTLPIVFPKLPLPSMASINSVLCNSYEQKIVRKLFHFSKDIFKKPEMHEILERPIKSHGKSNDGQLQVKKKKCIYICVCLYVCV